MREELFSEYQCATVFAYEDQDEGIDFSMFIVRDREGFLLYGNIESLPAENYAQKYSRYIKLGLTRDEAVSLIHTEFA